MSTILGVITLIIILILPFLLWALSPLGRTLVYLSLFGLSFTPILFFIGQKQDNNTKLELISILLILIFIAFGLFMTISLIIDLPAIEFIIYALVQIIIAILGVVYLFTFKSGYEVGHKTNRAISYERNVDQPKVQSAPKQDKIVRQQKQNIASLEIILEDLKSMYERDLLTQEEYDKKRKEVIDNFQF